MMEVLRQLVQIQRVRHFRGQTVTVETHESVQRLAHLGTDILTPLLLRLLAEHCQYSAESITRKPIFSAKIYNMQGMHAFLSDDLVPGPPARKGVHVLLAKHLEGALYASLQAMQCGMSAGLLNQIRNEPTLREASALGGLPTPLMWVSTAWLATRWWDEGESQPNTM